MPKILLIGYDVLVRKTLARLLKQAGHQVAEARHRREAMALISTQRPDLVIVDMLLPEPDGHELVETILRCSPPLPLIAITGTDRNESGAALRLKGHKHALAIQTFQMERLQEAIRCVAGAVGSAPAA